MAESTTERKRRVLAAQAAYQKRFEAGAKAARTGKPRHAPYKSYVARSAWEDGYRRGWTPPMPQTEEEARDAAIDATLY